ncbi:MAG TPA: tRNA (adenosine(37)-N6)-threonylcarbamoyltransferase complex transferase subunit TsaD [Rhabdochlamydiaceae bacterium]|nr:tRNA (adenosine(37)-N6)-threonylcarbamoyltransferase complex transferase subunit TsaD [Rhabdochlamydiaceae bacterium]
MYVLGIESTCDETGCAIVKDGIEILSNCVASQCDLHRPFGGVFPELASRRHAEVLIPLVQSCLDTASISSSQLDLIAVAKGPGLIGPLLIGLNAAKSLALGWNIPMVGVNHVEAHLYAAMMSSKTFQFPALGVVISGGHTFMVHILDVGRYQLIGTTVDDAIGEAFDKVASLLGLGYPGGPAIEALAKKGDPNRYLFKAGKVKNNRWNFSFSGLKTNVLYTIKGQDGKADENIPITEGEKADIAASFQSTAFSEITHKIIEALKAFPCHALYLGGGVSNNQTLRAFLAAQNLSVPIYWPSPGLSLDNGAMIAGLGFQQFIKNNQGDVMDLQPMTRIPLES